MMAMYNKQLVSFLKIWVSSDEQVWAGPSTPLLPEKYCFYPTIQKEAREAGGFRTGDAQNESWWIIPHT